MMASCTHGTMWGRNVGLERSGVEKVEYFWHGVSGEYVWIDMKHNK